AANSVGNCQRKSVFMDVTKAQKSLEHFGRFLSEWQEQITEEWMAAVRADGRLQSSERLKVEVLKEHLPDLFRNLVDLIRSPADLESQHKANENARTHGSHRFGQIGRASCRETVQRTGGAG